MEMDPESAAGAPQRFNPLDYPLCLAEPRYLSGTSAWEEHIPFAFACIEMLRPRVFVELGTHKGDSYCAFCQAVDTLRLATKCYAIDTWKGDEHAGFYDGSVFRELKAYHDPLYGSFSRLIRSTFDEALAHFPDGSVDLLHIDGLHTYEAVRHDFEAWLPKMTARGIVLLHDTNVRERGFGVGKLWSEVSGDYPTFEFVHGHGLGILAVGSEAPEALLSLTAADQATMQAVRSVFFALGRRAVSTRETKHLEQRLNVFARQANERAGEIERLQAELAARGSESNERAAEIVRMRDQAEELRVSLNNCNQEVARVKETRRAIKNSVVWTAMKPLWKIERRLQGSDASSLRIFRSREKRSPKVASWKMQQRLKGGANNKKGKQETAKLEAPRLAYPELLIKSLFKPVMRAPYDQQDDYFIASLESQGKYLADRYKDNPQPHLVSIIMPTFNRAHCIGEAIRSVIDQSYTNWELIIVDDNSSDSTYMVVSSFADPRIRYIRLEGNFGAAGARNAAFDQISGSNVTYLDSDNTMNAQFLLVLVNELEESRECDMVYCVQRAFDCSGGEVREIYVRFAPFHRPSLENANYIDLGALMHRRSVADRYGKFNDKMQRLSDWEFVLRCTTEKAAKAVPAILSSYYFEKDSNQITRVHSLRDAQAQADAWIRRDPLAGVLPGISLDGLDLMFSLSYNVPEPRTRRPVSIVIPSFEAEPYLRACVEAIYAFSESHSFELIIVDNASSFGVTAYLKELAQQGRAKVLFNDANLGFTFAVNQGIGAALPLNDVVIMNNDAIVTRGWLGALQTVICDYPDVGLVVPSQTVLGCESSLPIHQPHRDRTRECDINISAHHANVLNPLFDAPKGYIELTYAPFFCIYLPRATLDLVGVLDVEKGPHYRSDRLYCDLVRAIAERRIIYTPHSKVYHFVQRATHDLKTQDFELYNDMYVRNDWAAIASRDKGRASPNRKPALPQDTRQSALRTAADFWSKRTSSPPKRLTWGHFPMIRAHITKRIIGQEMFSISAALVERAKDRYSIELPLKRAVSVGAGTCVKEISLAKDGYVVRWDCFEISPTRITAGQKLAADAGVLDRITFRSDDAFKVDCRPYDLVFWSASLHHMFDISQALRWSLDHLKPGGLFLMDEYVGPNRFQWTDEMLEIASTVRSRLDDRHLVVPEKPERRFPRKLRRPDPRSVCDADPTESFASAEILNCVAKYMPSADVIHLGGVVYHVALSGILTNFTALDEHLLKDLLALDGALADQGQSVFATATYQKGPTAFLV